MNTNDNMKINQEVQLQANTMIIVKTHNNNYKTIMIPIFNLVDCL